MIHEGRDSPAVCLAGVTRSVCAGWWAGSGRARHLQCHGGSFEDPGPTGPSLALHHLLLHTSLPQGRFTLDEEPDLPLVVLHVVQAKSRGLKKVLMSFNF